MIRIELEMDKPKECHECPFQLKFKNDEADDWYTRRCVIMHQQIEYPLPDWCPIEQVQEDYKLMENVEEIIKKLREECEGCPLLGEYDCKADPYTDGCYKENKTICDND